MLRLWRPNTFAFRLALIGSIITDFDEIGVLPPVHGRSRDFLQYLQRVNPRYVPLAVGMVMHEQLDKLMDEDFVNPNEPRAKELLNEYDSHFASVRTSHLVLDHSLDAWVLRHEPSLVPLMQRSRRLRKGAFRKMAFHLSVFFNGDYRTILRAMEAFRRMDLSPFKSLDGLSETFVKYLFLQSQQSRLVRSRKVSMLERLRMNVVLGLAYGKFLLHERKDRYKALLEKARTRFGSHECVYSKVERKLRKSVEKVLVAYSIALK